MATATICDICKEIILVSTYDVQITKKEIESDKVEKLIKKETCQKCFIWIEREMNRLKSIKEMS